MDNKELEKIYNDTYRSVYWTAMSLLKDEEDAQDIVQETYVTLIDSYDTLKDKEKVTAWLKKIAANKCLDRLRRTKTVNAEDVFFENVEAQPEDFLPDSILESAEKRRIIMDIIDNALSEDIKRTLVLYYYDEMTTKEIATLLGIPQGTVLWRLNFAKKKIKKEVEKYEEENNDKLYAMAPVPFLTKLFTKEAEQVPLKPIAASLLGLSASADVPAKAVAAKAASSAAAKGVLGLTLNKIIIAVVALILAITAAVVVIPKIINDTEEITDETTVAETEKTEADATDASDTDTSADITAAVYTRQDETVVDESAPATPLSADPASAFIGTWTGNDGRNITYLTLNADGTMDVLLLDPSGVEVNRMHYTYTVEGDEMVWTMDSQSARISYILDGDTLTFIEPDHPDQPLILTRSDDYVEADYTTADLAGTWVAYSNGEQGFFTDDYRILDLYWSISEDGTLESYGVDSDGVEYDRKPNTYTISGNELTITGSSGEPATYYIRIDGDTMTLGGIGANDSYWIFTRIA